MDYRYFQLIAACMQISLHLEADVASAVQMFIWH